MDRFWFKVGFLLLVSICLQNFKASGQSGLVQISRFGRGWVTSVEWQPNGDKLAVGGSDGVWIYTDTYQDFAHFETNSDYVKVVQWNSNGQRLASATHSGLIQIWDLQTLEVQTEFEVGAFAGSISWNPNGNHLAIASENRVTVWDTTTGTLIETLPDAPIPITTIAWSPDGKSLAESIGEELDRESWEVRIWDTETWEIAHMITLAEGLMMTLVWSPDSTMLAGGSLFAKVVVWQTSDYKRLHVFEDFGNEVNSVVWTPDSTRLITAGADREILVWEISSGNLVQQLKKHCSNIVSLSLKSDGTTLASVGAAETIFIWDLLSGNWVTSFSEHTNPITDLAWEPSGGYIAASSNYGPIHVWDTLSSKHTELKTATENPCRLPYISSVIWSPNTDDLAAIAMGETYIWDSISSASPPLTLSGYWIDTELWMWTSENLLVDATDIGIIQFWDPATGNLMNSIEDYQLNRILAINPDGTRFVIRDDKGNMVLVGQNFRQDFPDLGEIQIVKWHSGGQKIAFVQDNLLRIWDVESASLQNSIAFPETISHLDWHRTSDKLAVVTAENIAYLWSTEMSDPQAFPFDDFYEITSIEWSADGSQLALSDSGGFVYIFDVTQ